jgi:hypothetical protein
MVITAAAVNGPACSPPGPPVSVRLPCRSRARPPVLSIGRLTVGLPLAARRTVGTPSVKLDAGAPPGPMERYSRMPTRLTNVTLPGPFVSRSAQMTPYCSPGGASGGTATVATSMAAVCGARLTVPRLVVTQAVMVFWVCPGANWKAPWLIEAAAG